ncbi:MAG: hypothetical protein M3463_20780 [Verrucomicrobiota bacterium]|nr:hypothetical protein [Verrucomicrobiota bacterium]
MSAFGELEQAFSFLGIERNIAVCPGETWHENVVPIAELDPLNREANKSHTPAPPGPNMNSRGCNPRNERQQRPIPQGLNNESRAAYTQITTALSSRQNIMPGCY